MFINKSPSAQIMQIAPVEKLLSFSTWSNVNMGLLSYSIAVLSIHRNGGSEAYSFIEPRQNVTAVSPLTYTVCGQKVDALSADCSRLKGE